ncbi:unnamed protein product [Rhizophagus irregularis]|nr:unnamed protein product [Rhizophagus irregularis]
MSTSQKRNIIEVDNNTENYLNFDECQNIDDESNNNNSAFKILLESVISRVLSGGHNQDTCKKGGSKLHSWKKKDGDECKSQIKTKGPTGNIIHHLSCIHGINQDTKIEDLTLNQPHRKQMKLEAYNIDIKQQV